jgi:hypothetical protein
MAVQSVESVVNELLSAIEEGYTHTALVRAVSQLAVIIEDQDLRISELEQHVEDQANRSADIEKRQQKLVQKVKKLRVLAARTDEKTERALDGVARVAKGGMHLAAMQDIANHGTTALCATLDAHREEYLRRINGLAMAGQITLRSLEELAEKYNDLAEAYNELADVVFFEEEEPLTEE